MSKLTVCRSQQAGQLEMQGLAQAIEDRKAKAEELAAQIQDAEADIKSLQTEKDLQSGGEVKELAEQADALSKRWEIGKFGTESLYSI